MGPKDAEIARAIKTLHLFATWPDDAVRELAASSRIVHVGKGKPILQQGDEMPGLYAILSGCIEIGSGHRDGRRHVRFYAEPGLVFGMISMFDDEGSPYFYSAHERSQILLVPKPAFLGCLERRPELWPSVALHLARRYRVALEDIDVRVFDSLRVRAANALVALSRAYGKASTQGTAIEPRLTQDNLASLLGVSRQSINKVLKQFESDGLIAINYGRIMLLDPDLLEQIPGAESGGEGAASLRRRLTI